jgi:hypothetical protein
MLHCERTNQKSGKTFTACEGEFWKQHPQEIRERCSKCLSPVEDHGTNLMVSPGLLDKLPFGVETFEDFAQKLGDSLDDRIRPASTSCQHSFHGQGTLFRAAQLLPLAGMLLCWLECSLPGQDALSVAGMLFSLLFHRLECF